MNEENEDPFVLPLAQPSRVDRPLKHGRLTRICVAVDAAGGDDSGARLAISLVRSNYHAEIDFFHVINTQRMIACADRTLDNYGISFELAREAARAALTRCSLLAEEAGVFARSYLRFGDPVTEGRAFARGRGADLVVIGNRPAGKLHRILNGSVRDEMVRTSPLPLLLAPNRQRRSRDFDPRCVLVAGADAPNGRAAKRLAADLAADYGAQLILVPNGSGGTAEQKEQLDRTIREHAPGLIVMTCVHGNRLRNVFAGDLIEQTLQESNVPILIVRADEPATPGRR